MAALHDGVDRKGPPEEDCEVVIVGAGMEALNVVARLPEAVLKKTVVIDSAGDWLAAWGRRAQRLGTTHLRSPLAQHPHASPLALQQYVERHGRQQDLAHATPGSPPMPSAALMRDFCLAKVVRKLPPACWEVRMDTVVRLETPAAAPAPGSGNGSTVGSPSANVPASGAPAEGCRVHLASGAVLHARAVVLTESCRQPILPAWARQLAATAAGVGKAGADGATQLPAGVSTWDALDLQDPTSTAAVAGRRVAIVGGGMASAQLALGAAAAGAAAVTLLARRPLAQQAFGVPVGWWGGKHLNDYRQEDDLALRLAACRRARRQATLDAPTWQRLVAAAAAGQLTVAEGCEVAEVVRTEGTGSGGWRMHLQGKQAAALQGTPFQQEVAAAAASAGTAQQAKENCSEGGNESSAGAAAAGAGAGAAWTAGGQQELQADLVWLACGSAYNMAGDPLLSQLQEQHTTQVVSGYPWVDEEHLCWPGAPVYLAGHAARLALGPCAGELPGMRLAADRITRSLKRLGYAEAPVWKAAVQRLARLPAAGAGPVPAPPLEEEGVAWEEPPRPKASLARPPQLVDVSDLPKDLPRQEVQRYTFTDCDFEICIIIQLGEPVPLDKVRVVFGPQSLDAWAVGTQGAYHIHIPKLYAPVIVKRCSVKVNQKARKVYLLLHKQSDAEWRFLKAVA